MPNTENKLLRKKQFENVIKELWRKAKEKFAKLDEENIFTAKNTFKKEVILSDIIAIGETPDNCVNSTGDKKFGRRDFTTHKNGNDGYVKSLLIKAADNIGEGERVTFRVWRVTANKETLEASDVSLIVNDRPVISKTYDDKWGVCFEIEIGNTYSEEQFFMYRAVRSSEKISQKDTGVSSKDNIYINDASEVNNNVLNSQQAQTISGVYAIIGRKNVENALSEVVKDVSGQGSTITVTKVDGTKNTIQFPQGGGTTTSLPSSSITHAGGNVETALNGHDARIATLERKHPTVRVGEVVQSYKREPEIETVEGATYIRCDGNRDFLVSDYPDLANVLGQSNQNRFRIPLIHPVQEQIQNAGQIINVNRYTYIVAKVN